MAMTNLSPTVLGQRPNGAAALRAQTSNLPDTLNAPNESSDTTSRFALAPMPSGGVAGVLPAPANDQFPGSNIVAIPQKDPNATNALRIQWLTMADLKHDAGSNAEVDQVLQASAAPGAKGELFYDLALERDAERQAAAAAVVNDNEEDEKTHIHPFPTGAMAFVNDNNVMPPGWKINLRRGGKPEEEKSKEEEKRIEEEEAKKKAEEEAKKKAEEEAKKKADEEARKKAEEGAKKNGDNQTDDPAARNEGAPDTPPEDRAQHPNDKPPADTSTDVRSDTQIVDPAKARTTNASSGNTAPVGQSAPAGAGANAGTGSGTTTNSGSGTNGSGSGAAISGSAPVDAPVNSGFGNGPHDNTAPSSMRVSPAEFSRAGALLRTAGKVARVGGYALRWFSPLGWGITAVGAAANVALDLYEGKSWQTAGWDALNWVVPADGIVNLAEASQAWWNGNNAKAYELAKSGAMDVAAFGFPVIAGGAVGAGLGAGLLVWNGYNAGKEVYEIGKVVIDHPAVVNTTLDALHADQNGALRGEIAHIAGAGLEDVHGRSSLGAGLVGAAGAAKADAFNILDIAEKNPVLNKALNQARFGALPAPAGSDNRPAPSNGRRPDYAGLRYDAPTGHDNNNMPVHASAPAA